MKTYKVWLASLLLTGMAFASWSLLTSPAVADDEFVPELAGGCDDCELFVRLMCMERGQQCKRDLCISYCSPCQWCADQ